MVRFSALTMLVLLGFFSPVLCQSPVSGALPHEKLRLQYNEGNFEEVIRIIQDFQKANSSYSRQDSIVIAKHLSVVYTANPATRELGQKYMHDLLRMMPSAELVDMYVSDEIYRIFDRVRKEFSLRQAADDEISGAPEPKPVSTTQAASEKPSGSIDNTPGTSEKNSNAKYYWIAGSAALVTAGVTAYLLSTEPEPEDKIHVVPID